MSDLKKKLQRKKEELNNFEKRDQKAELSMREKLERLVEIKAETESTVEC